MTRPFAWYLLRTAKATLTNPDALGLILCSRAALTMWEGVKDVQWSFLSPPWQLRDKGESIKCLKDSSLTISRHQDRSVRAPCG